VESLINHHGVEVKVAKPQQIESYNPIHPLKWQSGYSPNPALDLAVKPDDVIFIIRVHKTKRSQLSVA